MSWIPIKINPLFLVLIFALGFMNAPSSISHIFVWAGVAFISVLVHEWGHALTAVFFGQKAQIELFGLGGVTYREGPRLKLWKEFVVTLNGPLAGFALAYFSSWIMVAIGPTSPETLLAFGLRIAFFVNLFWTVLNLLPVYPLDGGHLMRIFLEGIFGSRGVRWAFFASLIFAIIGSVFFLMIDAFLGAALFFLFAFESYRGWKGAKALSEHDHDEGLQSFFQEGETKLSIGDRKGAYEVFERVRERSQKGMIFIKATEYMAQILAGDGHYKRAYELLYPLELRLELSSLGFLHQLAYRLGNWKEAIQLGTKVYQESPNYEVAGLNALAHAVLGEAEPAVGWLKAAISDGAPDMKEFLARREFDHIREQHGFQELEKNS